MTDNEILLKEELTKIKNLINFFNNNNANKKKINEQIPSTVTTYQGITPEKDSPNADQWIKDYISLCGNEKYLVLPEKNKFGATGEDALVKHYEFDKEDNIIPEKTKHFCLYRTPKLNDDDTIWIPSNSEIGFFDELSKNDVIQNLIDTRIKKGDDYTLEDISNIKLNLNKIIQPGQIKFFNIGGESYKPIFEFRKPSKEIPLGEWYFKGYGTSSIYGNPLGAYESFKFYVEPTWVDNRNWVQKTIDNHGWLIQIGTSIAIAFAGALTGGAAWVFYAEIVIEGVLGSVIAWRELQKGDNISAICSFIFGFLPIAKLNKWFRGVDEETFRSLSKKLSDSGLDISSTEDEWEMFILNKLNEKESILLKRALSVDEITKNEILSEVKNGMKTYIPHNFMLEAENFLKNNKNLIKNEDFIKRLFVREWTVNGVIELLALTLEITLGKKLNNEKKQILNTIYTEIPKQLQIELSLNLFKNIEKLEDITSNLKEVANYINSEKHKTLKEKNIDAYLNAINTKTSQAFNKSNVVYNELDSDSIKIIKKNNLNDFDKLKKEGWVIETDIKPEEIDLIISDMVDNNGNIWYKINK